MINKLEQALDLFEQHIEILSKINVTLKSVKMELDRLWYLVGKKISADATESELQELLDMLEKDPNSHYSMMVISQLWKSAFSREGQSRRPLFTAHWKQMAEHAIAVKYASLGLRQAKEEIIWEKDQPSRWFSTVTFMQHFVPGNYFDVAWKSMLRYNVFISGLLGLGAMLAKNIWVNF